MNKHITPTKSVTLTSKHQLTVPARVVRQLKLQAGDRLAYQIEGDSLVLRPRASVKQQLAALHALTARANKGVASDESIKQTLSDYHRRQTQRP
jgi:bifunctional DNA-binding transcriptional regulator/antitoxin component of YhaV-PrlF toxin-antitoxin module